MNNRFNEENILSKNNLQILNVFWIYFIYELYLQMTTVKENVFLSVWKSHIVLIYSLKTGETSNLQQLTVSF